MVGRRGERANGAGRVDIDDLAKEIEALKRRMTEWEDWASNFAEVLRRRSEEMRQAAGRLDQAEKRYSRLLERTDELERYAADQLGADVADLRKAMRGIGIVASGVEPRPIQVN